MANITGTEFTDTIHRTGDGVAINGKEFSTVTAGIDIIDAGAGNDFIYSHEGNDNITAGTGSDFIDGGNNNDTIDAGDGTDTIFGGQGADNMKGGNGNDIFYYAGLSEIHNVVERIDGGNDIDTIDFAQFTAIGAINISKAIITNVERLQLNANDVTLSAAQLGSFETISAGGNIDRLILSAAGTVDLTGAVVVGIDEFRGTAGLDSFVFTGVATGQTVNALAGNDTLTGGDGNDVLNGGADVDVINAGVGNDSLVGGTGVDTLNGEDGNDILNGGTGVDKQTGGAGNDHFRVEFVADVSGLAETLDGGDDTDRIDFAVLGGIGAANLSKSKIISVEELYLNANDITLTAAQLGNFTTLNAGGNVDRLILSAAGSVNLTDATITGIDVFLGSSGDDVFNFNRVATGQFVDGREGNDTMTGTAAGDKLVGDSGTDTLNGANGDDILDGGQDADVLGGGVGYDVFFMDQVSDINNLTETLDGGSDIDRLDFAAGGATGAVNLTKATLVNVEHLALNDNVVTLTTAQLSDFDIITSGGNIDRLLIANVGTTDLTNAQISGIDEIRGTVGGDIIILTDVAIGQTVNGMLGNDKLTGGKGADALSGNEGVDTLSGGDGADFLTGGANRDALRGGDGKDTFLYLNATDSLDGAATQDSISDFVHGEDVINLFAVDANVNAAGDQAFIFKGAAAFTGLAGELRYAGSFLLGDLDGDKSVDFRIELVGAPTVTASDIVL